MPGGFTLGLELCNASTSTAGSPTSKGTSVTASAKAYSGSFTTITASAPSDVCWMLVRIWPTANSSNRCFTQIAVGAASSEVVIVNDLMATSATNGNAYTEYSFPCSIPAGTRISARCNNTTADSNNIQMCLFDGSFTQMEGSGGVDSIGFITGNPSGTDIDPGATASTKGAYAQLSASTPRDYMGVMVCYGQNSTDNAAAGNPIILDIAIGASGSEIPIIPDFQLSQNGNGATSAAHASFFPIAVPAGTRISVRAASPNVTTGTRNIGVTLYGVYL